MQSASLEFTKVKGSHSGIQIANQVMETIQKYDLFDRIIGIVTDNASANDVAVGIIAKTLNLNENTYPKPEELHYHCFAHVLNLACQGEN